MFTSNASSVSPSGQSEERPKPLIVVADARHRCIQQRALSEARPGRVWCGDWFTTRPGGYRKTFNSDYLAVDIGYPELIAEQTQREALNASGKPVNGVPVALLYARVMVRP